MAPMKVLVIEDNGSIRAVIGAALEQKGFNVRSADRWSLKTFGLYDPNALLLDADLPGLDVAVLLPLLVNLRPAMRLILLSEPQERVDFLTERFSCVVVNKRETALVIDALKQKKKRG